MNPIPTHIILIGAPGSGKGTQAKKIVEKFGYLHLSTGELFRKKYAQQNEATKEGKASIDKGGFFSDEIAYQIIHDFIAENTDAKGIIYDGFPRDSVQAQYFIEKICASPIVIELQADENTLVKRLLLRGQNSHRADDKSEKIIRHRMELYHDLTAPVLKFFKDKKLLHSISSEGNITDIALKIQELLTSKK
ncbi:MAG: nucleoside monophosphate kinase [Flavobacteriaceae bacterium]|nr:nucleoside monophosphate kinase [Flavobacteriaceae bacterium]